MKLKTTLAAAGLAALTAVGVSATGLEEKDRDEDRSSCMEYHHDRELCDASRERSEQRATSRREQREFEREMARLSREMEQLAREMERLADDYDFDAADFEQEIMAALEENGVRIEDHGNGRETVWVSSDSGSRDDVSIRVENSDRGDDLVYFYYEGFDRPYSFVLEDGDRDNEDTTVHAYRTSNVHVVRQDRRDGTVETTRDDRGNPVLTIYTDEPENFHVIRLDRSRFDG